MAFKMKRGAAPKYKDLGSSFKHYVDDVKEHNDGHYDELQTEEEHKNGTRTHFPDGKKRTEREIAAYDENKNEESKPSSMLEEGRTDLASAAEAEPVEEEGGEEAALAMKSPVKDKMKYGPYSYSHNTQEATDSHYGTPHGPKPKKENKNK